MIDDPVRENAIVSWTIVYFESFGLKKSWDYKLVCVVVVCGGKSTIVRAAGCPKCIDTECLLFAMA